jgi:hypothetical protein
MDMRMKAITSASAILWGASMLVVGLINLAVPSYGTEFLRMMSSIYPGYHDSRTIGEVLLGTIYGVVDGAIMGVVFGLLYRWVAGQSSAATVPAAQEPTPLRRVS